MSDSTTFSIDLAELSLEQLVQVSQGMGREIERLRGQRAYLRDKIAQRLAAGERTSVELQQQAAAGDAFAPGATILARTSA